MHGNIFQFDLMNNVDIILAQGILNLTGYRLWIH